MRVPMTNEPKVTRAGNRRTMFRARLRKLRKRARLSQTELALCCGVKRGAISHLESGLTTPSFELLCRLADELACSVGKLCDP